MTDMTREPTDFAIDGDDELAFDDIVAAGPKDSPTTAGDDELAFDDILAVRPSDGPANDGDDELMFDDIVPPTPAKKSRRAPAKSSAAAGADVPAPELPPSAAPAPAATEEPADPPAPRPRPDDGSAGSANPQPAPRDRHRLVLLAIVGLALFTSLMSLGGLIAVSRTLATAQAERDQARDERAELAKLPETIAALDRASARLAAAAARADGTAGAAAAPGQATSPLTADDLRRSLDALRLALDGRQPVGVKALGDTLHSDFTEIGIRLDRIEAKVARAPALGTDDAIPRGRRR